jgi:DNA invertase Pin-like site-specific DNA recombinase
MRFKTPAAHRKSLGYSALHAPRAAFYARISTKEGKQHLENQLAELRTFAQRLGWEVVEEFTDEQSGAGNTRPGLDRLMKAAARRKFDLVAVFDLSRLTRGGPAQAFAFIERLTASKVQFWSITQEHFRTSGPAGALFIAIAAHIAEMERADIRARVQAGIDRARAAGRRLGRARRVVDKEKLREMHAAGASYRQIGKALGIGRGTVVRRLKEK